MLTLLWNNSAWLFKNKLFILYRKWSPFITKAAIQKDGRIQVKGMYYDVWEALEKRLNFTTKITKIGSKWPTMINYVANQDYDLVLTGNSQIPSRSKTVDFSLNIVPTSLRLFYVKSTAGTSNWFVYFKSFSQKSWIGTVTTTTLAFIFYTILQFLSTKVS